MSTVAIPNLTSASTADTAATPNTLALRDNSGNLAAAQLSASELKSIGQLTLKSATVTNTTSIDPSSVCQYFCNATGGGFTVTLPTAVGKLDAVVGVAKIDSSTNVVTVAGGLIANTLTTQGASSRWQSDGAAFNKVG